VPVAFVCISHCYSHSLPHLFGLLIGFRLLYFGREVAPHSSHCPTFPSPFGAVTTVYVHPSPSPTPPRSWRCLLVTSLPLLYAFAFLWLFGYGHWFYCWFWTTFVPGPICRHLTMPRTELGCLFHLVWLVVRVGVTHAVLWLAFWRTWAVLFSPGSFLVVGVPVLRGEHTRYACFVLPACPATFPPPFGTPVLHDILITRLVCGLLPRGLRFTRFGLVYRTADGCVGLVPLRCYLRYTFTPFAACGTPLGWPLCPIYICAPTPPEVPWAGLPQLHPLPCVLVLALCGLGSCCTLDCPHSHLGSCQTFEHLDLPTYIYLVLLHCILHFEPGLVPRGIGPRAPCPLPSLPVWTAFPRLVVTLNPLPVTVGRCSVHTRSPHTVRPLRVHRVTVPTHGARCSQVRCGYSPFLGRGARLIVPRLRYGLFGYGLTVVTLLGCVDFRRTRLRTVVVVLLPVRPTRY